MKKLDLNSAEFQEDLKEFNDVNSKAEKEVFFNQLLNEPIMKVIEEYWNHRLREQEASLFIDGLGLGDEYLEFLRERIFN